MLSECTARGLQYGQGGLGGVKHPTRHCHIRRGIGANDAIDCSEIAISTRMSPNVMSHDGILRVRDLKE